MYELRELRNSRDLLQEGKKMKHCVGSYAESCYARKSSIWSMRCNGERQLTIEVNKKGVLLQAYGNCNQDASKRQRKILKKWVKLNNLTVDLE